MMSIYRLFSLLTLLWLTGCAKTPEVTVDYDTNYTFKQPHSFTILPLDDKPLGAPSLVFQRLEKAITEEMIKGGNVYVRDREKADILVFYAVVVEKKLDIDTYYDGAGFQPFWASSVHTTTRVREYSEGMLVLDMIDRKTNKVVWNGVMVTNIKSKLSPEERERNITKVVQLILKQYPPASK